MTDQNQENEFLKPENYYEGYQKNIEALKNNGEIIEVDKLHYLTFRSEEGKKLLELYKDRYIFPGFVAPTHAQAANACLYYEGFKEAFRMIFRSIKSHEQRIEAENNK